MKTKCVLFDADVDSADKIGLATHHYNGYNDKYKERIQSLLTGIH